jgi:hypothetical protein
VLGKDPEISNAAARLDIVRFEMEIAARSPEWRQLGARVLEVSRALRFGCRRQDGAMRMSMVVRRTARWSPLENSSSVKAPVLECSCDVDRMDSHNSDLPQRRTVSLDTQ